MVKLDGLLLALAMVAQVNAVNELDMQPKSTAKTTEPAPRILSEQEKTKRLGDLYLLCEEFKFDMDRWEFVVIGNKCYKALTIPPYSIFTK